MVLCFEHLDEFYDVWVIYFGENCYLIVSKLAEFGGLFEFLYAHGFDGEHFISFAINSSKNIAILSASNTFKELVILYIFVHFKIYLSM